MVVFQPVHEGHLSALAVRFVDGYIINETTLDGIRARVAEFLS